MRSIACVCLIIVISGQLVYVSSKACVMQQAKVLFAFDGTTNINDVQRNLMLRFVEAVVTSLPDGSEGGCVYINQESKEITRFTVSGSRPNLTEEAERIHWKPTRQTITARALAKEVNMSFPVAFLQRKAEIFYLLVSDTTIIESFPEVLLKKKMFIVVFGSAIPNKLKSLASSAEYINLIRNFNDLKSVVVTVTQLTRRDSFLKCDVDEYMGKRASKCTSCMNVCSQTTSKQPRACNLHCPYILLPPRE
ncbi:uncharacterized protein LOC123548460 [Mercenaria mercenaria]|uniref:uncharacterized protein LOC123548460 n=1 Tax=Mercenaria mercenaria TaxID=6596 RepID=UPI00234F6208|nr:uncharacterized protein LOC123548460 [Mercenaria mercenaria]